MDYEPLVTPVETLRTLLLDKSIESSFVQHLPQVVIILRCFLD